MSNPLVTLSWSVDADRAGGLVLEAAGGVGADGKPRQYSIDVADVDDGYSQCAAKAADGSRMRDAGLGRAIRFCRVCETAAVGMDRMMRED